MAATNALLTFGGMTHCCWRWGLRRFFWNPTDRSVAGTIDDCEFHDFVLQHPQGPARSSLGRRGTSQRDQFGFLLAIKNPSNRRRRALLAAQNSLKTLFHQLLAHPVNHRRAGIQRPNDPAVAPACAAFRDISLQQYPRLQQPSRRALSLPKQRLKLFALRAAQPHNVLLYRNILRRHDRSHRPSSRRQRITKSEPIQIN